MDNAVLVSRVLLAAVFAAAGVAKVFGGVEFRRAVAAFGIPDRLVAPIGVGLPALELAVAVLLLSARWAWWGAAMATGVLIAFIVAIAVNLAKGRQPDCHCFGQFHSKPIGPATLARNVALAGCAGLILAGAPDRFNISVLSGLAGVSGVSPIVVALGLVVLVVLAAETFFLWQLFRQQGRLWLRLDQLEQRLVPFVSKGALMPGLPFGALAPSFELSTPSRAMVGLDTLLQGGRAALLIFSDSNCQPCAMLLPEIKRWQQDYANDVRIALVSRGSEDANRSIAERFDLEDVLFQVDSEVSDAYHVYGTPAAVLVRADGTIGAPVAISRDAIADLLKLYSDPPAQSTGIGDASSDAAGKALTYGTALR